MAGRELHEAARSGEQNAPDLALVLKDALLAQAGAIREAVQSGKPKTPPQFGPAPTDPETGLPKVSDATFFERDGKSYPAVIESKSEIPCDFREGRDKFRRVMKTVFSVRVNFGKEIGVVETRGRKDDWRPVGGVVSGRENDRRRLKRYIEIKTA